MTMVYFKILILLCHYTVVFTTPLPQYQGEYQGDYQVEYEGEYQGDDQGEYQDYRLYCSLPEELGSIGKKIMSIRIDTTKFFSFKIAKLCRIAILPS